MPDSVAHRSATRTVAVWVPDWPVAAALAEGVTSAHLPVAVHDGRGITAASARARAEGVRRGMRRRSAQAVCPELVLVAADEGRDVRAFEPIAQAMETVVAGVEVTRPGVAVLPARGPSRHIGSEEALAELLIGCIAQETGAECQVGIADGLLGAVLAARDRLIVPPGTTAAFLARRDVADLLHIATTREVAAQTSALTDLLRRLGLRTLGAFGAVSSRDVLARFGSFGVEAHRQARGLDARPPVTRRPEQDVLVRADLDPPAMRVDTAAFAARRLAEQLHERMMRRGVVCARLRVEARAETGQELTRTWRIDGALTAAELTDRVRWQLEGWISGRSGAGPGAPLVRLELAAEEVSPANVAQDGLWGRARRGEVQAGRAALRVQGLLGPTGVLTAVAQGGRAPRDRVRLVAWGDDAVPVRPATAPWPGQIPTPLPATVPGEPVPLRMLDVAGRPVVEDGRGSLSGEPARLLSVERAGTSSAERAGTSSAERVGDVTGTVEAWAGPWPVTERWWSDQPRRRTYVQVLLAGGLGLLVAAEAGSWWLEGIYD